MVWLVLGGSTHVSALLAFSGLLLGYAFAKRELGPQTVFGIMLASALLFPAFRLIEGFPAVRPEEAYIFIIAPVLMRRMVKKVMAVDLALLLMALSIAVSMFYGHFFLGGVLTAKNFFEFVEIVKYWLFFRLGLEIQPEEKVLRKSLTWFVCSGLVVAMVSIFQFYNLLNGIAI